MATARSTMQEAARKETESLDRRRQADVGQFLRHIYTTRVPLPKPPGLLEQPRSREEQQMIIEEVLTRLHGPDIAGDVILSTYGRTQ